MSTLVISYEELKEAEDEAKKTAHALEEDSEALESQVRSKILNYKWYDLIDNKNKAIKWLDSIQ